MSQDIFEDLVERQQDRLRELGWKVRYHWGTTFWESPETGAWLRWEQALEWLAQHDQQQEGGR